MLSLFATVVLSSKNPDCCSPYGCPSSELKATALELTMLYETFVTNDNLPAAIYLGRPDSITTFISHNCTDPNTCCTQDIDYAQFVSGFYSEFKNNWFNQQPRSATINECGTVTVHAVALSQPIQTKAVDLVLPIRAYDVEFVWRVDKSFRYACGQNPGCGLYLHHLTYRYVDCPAEVGSCSECLA